MHKSSWDDLRYILTVAEAGSVSKAARELGVNHATILRHLAAFESHHRVTLFNRFPTGYALTTEGHEVVESLREIELSIAGLQRQISGFDRGAEGELRVTTTDTILASMVNPHLPAFLDAYPKITMDVLVTGGQVDLARREADVALRCSQRPPDDLVGIRVCKLDFAAFASAGYLDRHIDRPLPAHRWLAPANALKQSPAATWLRAAVPESAVVYRADSFVALGQAACSGLGVALLPCVYGDQKDGLVRVGEPVPEAEDSLWLLTHRDLRRSGTVRAFIDHYLEKLRGVPQPVGVGA